MPQVGTRMVWERQFAARDFETFQELSGDASPLHADADYARAAGYAEPIVPLHLAASPLSAAVGMALPGRRALYLGHQLNARRPVLFDRPVTYSVKVISTSPATESLELSALAIQDDVVVLDGKLAVRVRTEIDLDASGNWPDRLWNVEPPPAKCSVIVTGASGTTASITALRLAEAGHDLILQTRQKGERVALLRKRAEKLGAEARIVIGDITAESCQDEIFAAFQRTSGPPVVFHCAAPPLDASAEDHFRVAYLPLRGLWHRLRRSALLHQNARLLLLGSAAQIEHVAGMADYVAGKVAATSFLDGLHVQNGLFGIRTATLAAGMIDTPYSEGLDRTGIRLLQPEEVADVAANWLAGNGGNSATGLVVLRAGDLPSYVGKPTTSDVEEYVGVTAQGELTVTKASRADSVNDPIRAKILELLNLPPGSDPTGVAMGATPGWDSFRQITLVMELEQHFEVHLTSATIEAAKTLDTLTKAVVNAIQTRS